MNTAVSEWENQKLKLQEAMDKWVVEIRSSWCTFCSAIRLVSHLLGAQLHYHLPPPAVFANAFYLQYNCLESTHLSSHICFSFPFKSSLKIIVSISFHIPWNFIDFIVTTVTRKTQVRGLPLLNSCLAWQRWVWNQKSWHSCYLSLPEPITGDKDWIIMGVLFTPLEIREDGTLCTLKAVLHFISSWSFLWGGKKCR